MPKPLTRPVACGASRRSASHATGPGGFRHHRTIPNEVGLDGASRPSDKGCYRSQETVARAHPGLSPAPAHLLHLDGSENHLPAVGAEVKGDGKVVGFVGSSARHHELGPIALAVVKRRLRGTPLSTLTTWRPCRRSWSSPRWACIPMTVAAAAHRLESRGLGPLPAPQPLVV